MSPGADSVGAPVSPFKAPTALDFLEQARAGLEYVARFLEHPNAAGLENAARCLQVIFGQLQTYQALTRGQSRDTAEQRKAKEAVQEQLLHVNVMFKEAGVLFGGWKRVLSTRLGGYTRQGRPAPLRCRKNVTTKI
jgi:hypothetical protein